VSNLESPVKEEFQIVVDEIAMGRTMDQALSNLAARIDEPDINFFVVVLNVQQETGGNLSEVINNLSVVIRKRKQLRLKIRAMTSEGRATGWVLGALPLVVFAAIMKVAPTHLDPLLHTSTGNIILAIAAGLVVLALWIVRRMVDIDI
jgi:tight adherence protein B